MVRLEHVTKTFETTLLNKVNLDVKHGEFAYLVGRTGAGKTTLLRMLAGTEQATSGQISVVANGPSDLGWISQQPTLVSHWTVSEHLTFARLAKQTSAKGLFHRTEGLAENQSIEALLSEFELSKLIHKNVAQLSGGQLQRLQIACVLIKKPKLILADEPTGAQDVRFRWIVLQSLLRAASSGSTVLFATHDLDLLKLAPKRTVYLEDGELIESGSSRTLQGKGNQNGFRPNSNSLHEKHINRIQDARF